jgi:hypothetical protein
LFILHIDIFFYHGMFIDIVVSNGCDYELKSYKFAAVHAVFMDSLSCNVTGYKIKLIIFLFIHNLKKKSIPQKWLMVSKSWLNPWGTLGV